MAVSIDQQFIEYIVKSLVSEPDAVKIERRIDEKGVLLELTVAPEDLGRVIGKRGATAQSLRTLLRALGTKNDARYNLKIIDVGGPRPARSTDNSAPAQADDSKPASQPEPADEPADDDASEPQDVGQATKDDTPASSDDKKTLAEKTRAELAELDDLDV
ncbi:MAG TPA: KH domain-containing protein [Candidatus Saccharimonadales bacterium]|nr:KH domain-containing protein [Candidatus Saccharimonadales bacterium]